MRSNLVGLLVIRQEVPDGGEEASEGRCYWGVGTNRALNGEKGVKNEACTGITRTEVSGMYKIQNCLLGTYRLLKNILETTEEILWV